MRRLIVMRHAKSSWSSEATSDHQRPLNERGQRDAPKVAAYLKECGWKPDFILSSDACRTRETCAGMMRGFEDDIPVEFVRGLYLAGYHDLLQEVAVVDDQLRTLLVLGHNPGWEVVVQKLTGEFVQLKTANAALLECDLNEVDWQQALRSRQQWQQIDLVRARELD